MKNNIKTDEIDKNFNFVSKNNVVFKRLKKEKDLNLDGLLKEKKKVYVEYMLEEKTKSLDKVDKWSKERLLKNKEKFRSLGNETIIESIAREYSLEILKSEKFNVFENFKRLNSVMKIYKKEASVLNLLLIRKLLGLYAMQYEDISMIKNQVLLGGRKKFLKKNESPAVVYGAYLLSPSSTKLFVLDKQKIISATNSVLNELDAIYKKQLVIYNYIAFLSRGIK